jgi:transposase InsO family protein
MHGGIQKTLFKVQSRYVWIKMRRDVERFVKHCSECMIVKAPNYDLSSHINGLRVPKECFHTISIDFKVINPPAGPHRINNILVVMDLLSRFLFIFPMADPSASNVIRILKDFFNEYAKPRIIIHDNGKQFVSINFKDFLDRHDIRSMGTAKYHPQANPVERANGSISIALRFAMLDKQDNHATWIKTIDDIARGLNTRQHSAHQMTPYLVLYGKDPPDPYARVKPVGGQLHQEIMKTAYDRSVKYHNVMKSNWNRKHQIRNFEVGDRVLIRYHTLSAAGYQWNAKLTAKWEVAEIIAKIGNNMYRVRDRNNIEKEISIEDIKAIYDVD